jgi:hypothetical protein
VIRSSQLCCTLAVFLSLVFATPAFTQQRPLVTEDPEVIGPGRLLIEAGFDWQQDVSFPVSGLTGNRFSIPTFGVSVGLSSIAELQIDGGLYQRLDITERRDTAPLAGLLDIDGDRTSDVEDFVVATKVRLLGETAGGRPALGLRFATKLPTASNENGLGSDMTDFFVSLLVAKTIQSIRVVGNGGVAIIGDPTSDAPQQHDLMTFGLSVARALTTSTEFVGEINGRLNFVDGESPPGGENRAVMRFGGRYTRGTVRIDGGVLLGMTSRDPQFGITAGFTWVFDAFRIP